MLACFCMLVSVVEDVGGAIQVLDYFFQLGVVFSFYIFFAAVPVYSLLLRQCDECEAVDV